MHGQEFHTGFWGHTALLGLRDHYLLPDYAGQANTASASLVPTNADVADLAHAQGALMGYVHPFDTAVDPDNPNESLSYALPVDAALGKLDYLEVMGYSDHLITSEVWYRLLNCGFRIPAGAGTDAFPNFASLRGPAGLLRDVRPRRPAPRAPRLPRGSPPGPHLRDQRAPAALRRRRAGTGRRDRAGRRALRSGPAWRCARRCPSITCR